MYLLSLFREPYPLRKTGHRRERLPLAFAALSAAGRQNSYTRPMSEFDDLLGLYDVRVPPERIAQEPASPRDSARLLVHDRATGATEHAVFRDLGAHLPPRAVLVLNETKVIPAKMLLTRASGGVAQALVLGIDGGLVRVMANRKFAPGEFLRLHGETGFTVERADGRFWLLRPSFPMGELQSVLDAHGTMPLPPYIKHSPLDRSALLREYQTVFAKEAGSVAAPTASLHFTPELLESLERAGVRIARVTLHVHLGTFASLTEEQWKAGSLHTERYYVGPEAKALLEGAKAAGDPIVAVGTTVVRTLESAADERGTIVRPDGDTSLFIREGYRFKMVDAMVTNFHVPRSSLLMLVCAFAGREAVLGLYEQAVREKYRFFSFGDAMLVR